VLAVVPGPELAREEVRDRGDVVAALGISGPTTRLEPRLDELGVSLSSQAAQLSSLLRGRSPGITITKEGVA